MATESISLADLRESTPTAKKAEVGGTAVGYAAGAPKNFEATQADVAYAGTQAADGSRRSNEGTATGYNAQTGEIDPETMTSAGQLAAITGKDSPLMRRAGEQGMLTAARRGLQNSSFAAGAATGAMVDRASPLAMQDAQTYFANMRANTDAANRAAEVSTGRETDVSVFNAQAQNQLEALNAQLETAVNQQNAEAANRIKQQIADLTTQVNLANADAATRANMLNTELQTTVNREAAAAQNQMIRDVLAGNQELNRQFLAGTQAIDLASIQGRYQQLISSNAAAAQIYNSYMGAIGAAMSNDKVTPDRIAQYVNVMAQQMEGSLEMIDAMNSLDLGDIEVPGATSSGAGTGARVAPGTEPYPNPSGGLQGTIQESINRLYAQQGTVEPVKIRG